MWSSYNGQCLRRIKSGRFRDQLFFRTKWNGSYYWKYFRKYLFSCYDSTKCRSPSFRRWTNRLSNESRWIYWGNRSSCQKRNRYRWWMLWNNPWIYSKIKRKLPNNSDSKRSFFVDTCLFRNNNCWIWKTCCCLWRKIKSNRKEKIKSCFKRRTLWWTCCRSHQTRTSRSSCFRCQCRFTWYWWTKSDEACY